MFTSEIMSADGEIGYNITNFDPNSIGGESAREVCVSADGNIVAVGHWTTGGTSNELIYGCRIYEKVGNTWYQRADYSMYGTVTAYSGLFGLDMSDDGNVVVMLVNNHPPATAGRPAVVVLRRSGNTYSASAIYPATTNATPGLIMLSPNGNYCVFQLDTEVQCWFWNGSTWVSKGTHVNSKVVSRDCINNTKVAVKTTLGNLVLIYELANWVPDPTGDGPARHSIAVDPSQQSVIDSMCLSPTSMLFVSTMTNMRAYRTYEFNNDIDTFIFDQPVAVDVYNFATKLIVSPDNTKLILLHQMKNGANMSAFYEYSLEALSVIAGTDVVVYPYMSAGVTSGYSDAVVWNGINWRNTGFDVWNGGFVAAALPTNGQILNNMRTLRFERVVV